MGILHHSLTSLSICLDYGCCPLSHVRWINQKPNGRRSCQPHCFFSLPMQKFPILPRCCALKTLDISVSVNLVLFWLLAIIRAEAFLLEAVRGCEAAEEATINLCQYPRRLDVYLWEQASKNSFLFFLCSRGFQEYHQQQESLCKKSIPNLVSSLLVLRPPRNHFSIDFLASLETLYRCHLYRDRSCWDLSKHVWACRWGIWRAQALAQLMIFATSTTPRTMSPDFSTFYVFSSGLFLACLVTLSFSSSVLAGNSKLLIFFPLARRMSS